MLKGWGFLNILETIFKERRPEITSAEDFMGCIHPREMTATCSGVVFIENLFILVMSEASSENGVYTTPI